MATRMEKYCDDHEVVGLRSQRNEQLYKDINKSELDKFSLSSNATVLSEARNNIDVDKIKKILDNKYRETPQRKSIRIEDEYEEEAKDLEETKEYDINAILEKAREQKEVNYEKERLKKIRDTQFDILKHLNLEKEEKAELPSKGDNNLMHLINTITELELQNKEKALDPLDILADLKDDTPSATQDNEEETSIIEEDKIEKKIDKSFYTNSVQFTDSDFDDFNDLKAEVTSHKIIIKFVLIIIILIILGGTVLFLNYFLDLGLF